MDYHRFNKPKNQIESATVTQYHRIPSPLTYISNYNKICNQEAEHTKQCQPIERKHGNMFLWNDGDVQLNKIGVPLFLQEKKIKKKTYQSSILQSFNNTSHNNVANQNQNSNQSGQNVNNTLSLNHQNNASSSGNNNSGVRNSRIDQNTTSNLSHNNSQDLSIEQDQKLQNKYKTAKQLKEKLEDKQIAERTELLLKLIEQNNAYQNRMKTSNMTNASHIDQTQRKYFSHTKQQMVELQNHILSSSKISKEIMDRKGLSLRKVLSSIPQEKLIQIIDHKQHHFMKIMNEKILPKPENRLNSQLLPKFSGTTSYRNISKTIRNTSCDENNNSHNKSQSQRNLSTSNFQQRSSKKEEYRRQSLLDIQNHGFNQRSNNHNITESKSLERQQSQLQLKQIFQSSQFDKKNQNILDSFKLTRHSSLNNNNLNGNRIAIIQSSMNQKRDSVKSRSDLMQKFALKEEFRQKNESINSFKENSKTEAIPQSSNNKNILNQDGLYYSDEMDELLGATINTESNNNQSNIINISSYKFSRQKDQNSSQDQNTLSRENSRNISMRVRAEGEVRSTIKKLQEMQQSQSKDEKDIQLEKHLAGVSADILNQMVGVMSRPKQYIDKVLTTDQNSFSPDKNLYISGLENEQKQNEKKNFFNYSNYFYSKYSKQNNGLSTKLSTSVLNQNDNFQSDIQHLISQVDNDYPHYSHKN